MFIRVLEEPRFERYDVSSLRTGTMAGSPCPIKVMKDGVSRLHMPEVTIAYAMIETSPVSFQSSGDDPLECRVTAMGKFQKFVLRREASTALGLDMETTV